MDPPALPPNADSTDRPTKFPSAFACHGKEAKLNWLKNDGTAAAAAASSPPPLSLSLSLSLPKTHFQSDLIKTAGGRANIHNMYMRVKAKGGRLAKVYLLGGGHKKHRENRY